MESDGLMLNVRHVLNTVMLLLLAQPIDQMYVSIIEHINYGGAENTHAQTPNKIAYFDLPTRPHPPCSVRSSTDATIDSKKYNN